MKERAANGTVPRLHPRQMRKLLQKCALRFKRNAHLSMFLWRETSIILKMEAPCIAALVKNPARSEWAPNSPTLKPERPAQLFTIIPTLCGLSATSMSLPPFVTERNSGPAGSRFTEAIALAAEGKICAEISKAHLEDINTHICRTPGRDR